MLKGPPRHPPARGAWGAIRARSAHTACDLRNRALDGKPRAGGRGAPARGLRARGCARRGPPTNHPDGRCSRSVQRTVARQDAERCQAKARLPNEVGQGWPSQPGARVARAQAMHCNARVRAVRRHGPRRIALARRVRRLHRCQCSCPHRVSLSCDSDRVGRAVHVVLVAGGKVHGRARTKAAHRRVSCRRYSRPL